MQLNNRIVLAFNRFYRNLLKDLKAVDKTIIKKNYKVFNKISSEHIEFFKSQFDDVFDNIINEDISALSVKQDFIEKCIVKEFSIKMILENVDDFEKNVFWNYLYILSLFTLTLKDAEGSNDTSDELFNTIITILSKIQKNEDVHEIVEDTIVDDDIKKIMLKIKPFKADENILEEPPVETKTEDNKQYVPPFPSEMQDSMICNLAKEISNEIDVSNIKLDKPEDVLKLMDFSSGNNIVGDIIKKVSTKIHDKINTGELKQEDLFNEAMSMMSMMNMGKGGGSKEASDMFGGMAGMASMLNNPMMSEMMKAMKKGKAAPKQDMFKKASARDRLRAKLEERRNKA
jgi:hypothetical protein